VFRKSKYLIGLIAMVLLFALPATVFAAVTYSDYRWTTPTIFERYGPGWNNVTTGGFYDTSTYYICYPAHGWAYVNLGSDQDIGIWHFPVSNRYFGELQAYITTSGTHRRAMYGWGAAYVILNQAIYHGWTSLYQNNYYYSSVRLTDYHDGYDYSATQKCDWDAIRMYY